MMLNLNEINVKETALLLMDYQHVILNNYLSTEQIQNVLLNTQNLLEKARNLGIKVIFVKVQFEAGYPEISPKNKVFSQAKKYNLFKKDDKNTEIHHSILPLEEETIIIKNRIGAFSHTNLNLILTSNNISNLVLAGLTTSGVVLTTIRQAFDLDYSIFFVEDCCADTDIEVHNFLTQKVFTQHATSIKSTDL